ncbi:hypothetical protein DIU36_07515 [Mucilaginibacter rubeus]|nr:hypothetical protein DIU36_07515 [Mucilaginibacter rubeus]
MLLKFAYLLFAIVTDLLVYSKLHKKSWFSNTQFNLIGATLVLFILLHLFNPSFLLPFGFVAPITIIAFAPILIHFWFNYLVIKRINRITTEQNKRFMATGLRIFSFFFLKFFFIMILIAQVSFIISPTIN